MSDNNISSAIFTLYKCSSSWLELYMPQFPLLVTHSVVCLLDFCSHGRAVLRTLRHRGDRRQLQLLPEHLRQRQHQRMWRGGVHLIVPGEELWNREEGGRQIPKPNSTVRKQAACGNISFSQAF